MLPILSGKFRGSVSLGSFNMTPLIDVVFLLIIFFLVVCRFIEAENFPVAVPDACESAGNGIEAGSPVTTITVMRTDEGKSIFAVGPERIVLSGGTDLTEQIIRLVDISLGSMQSAPRLVTLRIDREVCFSDAQYAIAAAARSIATDIRLAVLRDRSATEVER